MGLSNRSVPAEVERRELQSRRSDQINVDGPVTVGLVLRMLAAHSVLSGREERKTIGPIHERHGGPECACRCMTGFDRRPRNRGTACLILDVSPEGSAD